MKYRQLLLSLVFATIFTESDAQDALFTQFYYAPVYLNPGLTGCGKNNLRLSAITKMQWFNLYKPYKYIAAAADYSLYDDYQRNIVNTALLINHSGKGYLNNTNISGILGRSFGTNNGDCSNWFFSAAIQAGVNLANVNTKEFIFIDQLDQNGITSDPTQVDLFKTFTNKNYFDMSSGFVFTWNDFMIGGAAHHLNEPNISFNGKPEDGKLPRKYTGHLSWMYDNGTVKFKPTLIAQFQGPSSALIAGALIDFNEFPIEFGCWYRNNASLSNNNAFSIGFSWKWGEAKTVTSMNKEYSNKLGLSYDGEIVKPGLTTTHGSLEFGIQRDIIVNDNSQCPTASSGICNYRFPWEFF